MQNKSLKSRRSAIPYDSCVLEMPVDFARAHNLPEKSFVSLTLRNGELRSEIINYHEEDERVIEDFVCAFPGLDEEMRKVGD